MVQAWFKLGPCPPKWGNDPKRSRFCTILYHFVRFGSLPLKRCNSNEKSGSCTILPLFSLLIVKSKKLKNIEGKGFEVQKWYKVQDWVTVPARDTSRIMKRRDRMGQNALFCRMSSKLDIWVFCVLSARATGEERSWGWSAFCDPLSLLCSIC